MSISKYLSTPLIRNFLLAGVVLTTFSIVFISRVGATPKDASPGGRLVTFHDRGQAEVILTHAQTVGDALKDAHINVVKEDTVEPATNTQLVATDYTVNIYRARPVIVIDGAVREKVMTAAQTPDEISKAAGMTLHDEDTTTLGTSTDNIMADGASTTLTINRATTVNVDMYGTPETMYTRAKTVAKMLADKNIHMAATDTLSVNANTPVTADMSFAIWRNGVQTATVQEAIPFSTQQVQDENHPVGYHQVQTPGANGTKSVTYQITMQNGKEVARTAIQTVVLTQPTTEVDIVGAALPPGSHTDWMAEAGVSSGNYGYIDYIFTHESGWNPASRNPSGLYVGLGQTSPSKLSAACPNWQSDPICQIGYFNGYAVGRYGSWQAAYAFKKANGWW